MSNNSSSVQVLQNDLSNKKHKNLKIVLMITSEKQHHHTSTNANKWQMWEVEWWKVCMKRPIPRENVYEETNTHTHMCNQHYL